MCITECANMIDPSELDKFEAYIRTELGLSKETLTAYVYDVTEFINFIQDSRLNIESVEKFRQHLFSKRLKSSTIRRKMASIRCFCNHLASLGKIDDSIIRTWVPVKVERETLNVISDENFDSMLSVIRSRWRTTNICRDVSICLILYDSALRVSEVCGLNVGDVKLDRRDIFVRGKGGVDRIVPTTERCRDAVAEHINNRDLKQSDPLFVNIIGERISRHTIHSMLQSASRMAQINCLTAHTLRRSCATKLMNRGVCLDIIQALLGHADVSTTQLYLSVTKDKLKNTHELCHPFGA